MILHNIYLAGKLHEMQLTPAQCGEFTYMSRWPLTFEDFEIRYNFFIGKEQGYEAE